MPEEFEEFEPEFGSTEAESEPEPQDEPAADEPAAPHPPGFKKGMNWNSDDARKAYADAGMSFDEEQRKGEVGPKAGK